MTKWAAPDPLPTYQHELVDLNADGLQDAIVLISDPDYCGSGGCTMVVFQGTAQGFKYISRSTITNPPILVLSELRHGWHTLAVSVRGGGAGPNQTLMRFDGKKYPSNPSVQTPAAQTDLTSAQELRIK
jgi:hypothetical protein